MSNTHYVMDFDEINQRFQTFPLCKLHTDTSSGNQAYEYFEAECLSSYTTDDVKPAYGWVFVHQGVFLPGIAYALWKKEDLNAKTKPRFHIFFDNGQNVLLK